MCAVAPAHQSKSPDDPSEPVIDGDEEAPVLECAQPNRDRVVGRMVAERGEVHLTAYPSGLTPQGPHSQAVCLEANPECLDGQDLALVHLGEDAALFSVVESVASVADPTEANEIIHGQDQPRSGGPGLAHHSANSVPAPMVCSTVRLVPHYSCHLFPHPG